MPNALPDANQCMSLAGPYPVFIHCDSGTGKGAAPFMLTLQVSTLVSMLTGVQF